MGDKVNNKPFRDVIGSWPSSIVDTTGPPDRVSHRKWRSTKQHPSRAREGYQISCCLFPSISCATSCPLALYSRHSTKSRWSLTYVAFFGWLSSLQTGGFFSVPLLISWRIYSQEAVTPAASAKSPKRWPRRIEVLNSYDEIRKSSR